MTYEEYKNASSLVERYNRGIGYLAHLNGSTSVISCFMLTIDASSRSAVDFEQRYQIDVNDVRIYIERDIADLRGKLAAIGIVVPAFSGKSP